MAQPPLDHQALIYARLIAHTVQPMATPPAHQQRLSDWADTIRSGAIRQSNEQQIRGAFTQKFFVELLGYKGFGGGADYTLADKSDLGRGRADMVLGHFGPQGVKAQLTTLTQTAQTAAETRRDEIARFGRATLRDLVPGGLDPPDPLAQSFLFPTWGSLCV